ncbi:MAG: hypothetical protein M1825_005526 [Sarcosagium campestre]|nr:MAG: hypothetical protein M1825_005526 [Sarcosagium campestre]
MSDFSEDSEDSDIGWEEIDLGREEVESEEDSGNEGGDTGSLDLVLGEEEPSRSRARRKRKPLTIAERQLRLQVHKMHLLCLIAHVHMRSNWCNDEAVQANLGDMLDDRTVSYLNPSPNSSQFQRSRSFLDGLAQANERWRSRYTISSRGLERAHWAESEEILKDFKLSDDVDPPMEIPDFRKAANALEGSRDVGVQLYCALLRSVGVETRLICSLQPLPFTAAGSKPSEPPKIVPSMVVDYRDVQSTATEGGGTGARESSAQRSVRETQPGSLVPQRARRLGLPPFGVDPEAKSHLITAPTTPERPTKRKRIRQSPYPVYWVECFNEALQKWIPVDPLVTNTIAKPTKFEPPASDTKNSMAYVIAVEEESVVRDVTRRYTKAYNAKTRKSRVEATKGGVKWWTKALRHFSRGWSLDRDQVEDSELASHEAQEPMPRNVQDFKDHPYYALERHLRRNEVIHPKSSIGHVATGRASVASPKKPSEPVYRRRDVHVVKSADGWYRIGREIKTGEQPLKFIRRPRKRARSLDGNGSDDSDADAVVDEDGDTGVYAFFQTTLYKPPPVVNGRIPKNAYGNLDIYSPSMVPEGGVHLQYPSAAHAARIIGIDYADAVTGFQFRGRHGTAIVRGIIVAAEYQPAVEAVAKSMHDEQVEEENARKSLEALRLWKRFLAALRIKERIQGYDVEGDGAAPIAAQDLDDMEREQDEIDGGGGFFLDRDQDRIAEPTASGFHRQDYSSNVDFSVGGDTDGGFFMEDSPNQSIEREDEPMGGGFLAEESPVRGNLDTASFSPIPASHTQAVERLAPSNIGTPDDYPSEQKDISNSPSNVAVDQSSDLVQQSRPRITKSSSTTSATLVASKCAISHPPLDVIPKTNQETNTLESTSLPDVSRGDGEISPANSNADKDMATRVVSAALRNEEYNSDNLDHDDSESLISHDPEDDDAEPDWLMSD